MSNPSDARRDHGQILARAAAILARSTAPGTGVSQLVALAVEALEARMAAVFLHDPDRPRLELAASSGIPAASLDGFSEGLDDPADPFVMAARERVASFDREGITPAGRPFVGAYLPLVVTSGGVETVLGALGLGWEWEAPSTVDAAPGTLDGERRELLTALADLIAVAAERDRLAATAVERSEWFERLAHTDPLTGLANERTVGRILELELARASRQGSEVSLGMFDVDDFRETNLDGGHETGDDVLRRVAAVLAESVRLVDTVGRVGGDEFVLVAPGSAGITVAERVMSGIRRLPPVGGRAITVSAGIARFPGDAADADALITAARTALERARSEGRGTIAGAEVAAEG
ncbi:MAG: diguanylate cyclase [Chloroflexota bacterium]